MPEVKRKRATRLKTSTKSRASTRLKATSKTGKTPTKGKPKSKPVFFHNADTLAEGGFLSPWWRSEFHVKDVMYKSAGQYILAEKARAFGDKKRLLDILETESTEELISLSTRIKGVDEKSWRRRAPRIAKLANKHKFTADDAESRELLQRLKKLGNREVVFADPKDVVLGIGFGAADAEENRELWGANIFGKSLDAVRTIAKVTAERKVTRTKDGYEGFDTSIFDVSGRMSVNW